MNTFRMMVWGSYAYFEKPDKDSYPILTPAAAKGILDAIYWTPGMHYQVTQIDILNPVKYTRMLLEESHKIGVRSVLKQILGREEVVDEKDHKSSVYSVLKDVRYVIHAEIMAESQKKKIESYNILLRRADKGQCAYQPTLGKKDFPCEFKMLRPEDEYLPVSYTEALGMVSYSLYGRGGRKPVHRRIEVINGILRLSRVERRVKYEYKREA